MPDRAYLGIDPGQSGGLALLGPDGGYHLWKMPGSPAELRRLLRVQVRSRHSPEVPLMAVLEKAQAMPKQGIAGAFNYGVGYGVLLGMLTALRLPIHEVRPTIWKNVMLTGIKDKTDKKQSIRRCLSLFPDADLTPGKCRTPQDGLAEALLLAEYGRRLTL